MLVGPTCSRVYVYARKSRDSKHDQSPARIWSHLSLLSSPLFPSSTTPLLFSLPFTSLQLPRSHSQIKCFRTTIPITHSRALFRPCSINTSPLPISFALLFSEHCVTEFKRRKAIAQSRASPHGPLQPNSSMWFGIHQWRRVLEAYPLGSSISGSE